MLLVMKPEIPLNPPREWFTPPSTMSKDAGCVVEPDGRVYGYLCHWGSVLMDGTNDRWTPPRSRNGYEYAHTGDTMLEDGSLIKTANLGGDAGHAPVGSGDLDAIQDFYENTQTQLARIRFGEDDYGVWFAGACWPTVTELDMAKLRASARSGHWAAVGDWRDIRSGRSGYELVGACLVNVPGLKYARADKAASGVISFNPVRSDTVEHPTIERVAAGTIALTSDTFDETLPEQPVGGVLLVEGTPTEDGRLIEAGASEWRELPLPLYASLKNLPGHDSADLVGRIDEVWRSASNPSIVEWSGVVIPGAAGGDGQEVLNAIRDKLLKGVSIDGIAGPDDVYYNQDDIMVMSKIIVAGATLTPMPAFSDATVTLLSAATEGFNVTDQQAEELAAEDTAAEENPDAAPDDQWAAVQEAIASLADRTEYLIGLVEQQQMSARLQAAEAKIKSVPAEN